MSDDVVIDIGPPKRDPDAPSRDRVVKRLRALTKPPQQFRSPSRAAIFACDSLRAKKKLHHAYLRRLFPKHWRHSADFPEVSHSGSDPVTVVLRHSVRRNRFEKWKIWVRDLIRLARDAPGYQGSFVVKDGENYVIVSQFMNYNVWKRWVESPVRHMMMKRLEDEKLIRRPPEIEYPAGGIFQFSHIPAPQPPAKWKMLILLTAIFYPINLILYYSLVRAWRILNIPPPVYILINQPISLIISIFVVGPLVTWIFRGWLYRPKPHPRWIPRWLYPFVC